MALAIDGSTPVVATNAVATVATVTSASFTPPAGALLLVLWVGDTVTGVTPSAPTITDNLGAHLTYTLLDWMSHADSPFPDGQSAIWSAVVGSSAAMTVTVTTGTASGAREAALRVMVITGQHATPIGAHSKAGSTSAAAIAQNFTGTASGSWGFIADCDWDTKGTQTAGTGCTIISAATIGTAISYGFARRTTADGTNGGTTTLNVTLPGTSTALGWCYAEVIPAAVSAAVYPPGATTSRRRPMPARRSRAAAPPLVTAPAPVGPARPAWRAARLVRRGAATPVPAQAAAPPPPAKAADPGRRVLRPLVWRRSRSVSVPAPVPVPAAPKSPRRPAVIRRRSGAPAPVPAQDAALPPRRVRRTAVVWRRPGVPSPVPPQAAAPTPPAYPGWLIRSRRVLTGRRAPGAPAPVPPQVTPPAAPALPLWSTRPHRVVTALRRGRAVTPVPPQATPPAAPPFVAQLRTARRVLLPARRRPAAAPVPVQDLPLPPTPRRRLLTPARHRPGPTPVPAQVAAPPAPVYPRQPLRHRIVALLLRRPGRLRFPEQPGAAVVGAVDGFARPGDGRPTQSAGPGSGTPPNTATGGDGTTIHSGGG